MKLVIVTAALAGATLFACADPVERDPIDPVMIDPAIVREPGPHGQPLQPVIADPPDAAMPDATCDAAPAVPDAEPPPPPDAELPPNLCCCGNGEVEPGEQCDDGNHVNGDGCDFACQLESPPGE